MTPRAGHGLATRLREWRSRSISNQITVAAATVTLAVASFIGLTTFLAVNALVARNIGSALESQARLVEQKLASDLEFVVKDATDLAQNSFIANGLVDSLGRDTYLLPFLREHRHPLSLKGGLVLCDFQGSPIASTDPSMSALAGRVAGVRRALQSAQAVAEVGHEVEGAALILSLPVLFPPTGQVEGVIIERFDLRGVLAGATTFLAAEESALLTVEGHTVVAGPGGAGRALEASVSVRPRLPAPLSSLDVRLEVGTRAEVYAPFRRVAAAYVLIGGLTVLVVVLLSRTMARRLARPIESLSRVAGEVAAGGEPVLAVSRDDAGEVRALGDAIGAMVKQLRAANEELEERVRARTVELKARERELERYAETQAVLLREVNHRVKNNLAAIISVLHLEEARAGGRDKAHLMTILGEMESRIRSLATVHALLSGAEWRPIPLEDLCRKLLRTSLGGAGAALRVEPCAAPVLIESGQAHHLALVLNELATNTLKHGAVDGRGASVEVSLQGVGGEVELTYRDRGPGFPPSVLAGTAESIGTGLQLVRGIVETSLAGTLSLSNEDGAVTSIRFAVSPASGQGASA